MNSYFNMSRLQILTKFHANIFIWIFLPKLFISICIAHQWKNNILDNSLQLKKKVEDRLALLNQSLYSVLYFTDFPHLVTSHGNFLKLLGHRGFYVLPYKNQNFKFKGELQYSASYSIYFG